MLVIGPQEILLSVGPGHDRGRDGTISQLTSCNEAQAIAGNVIVRLPRTARDT